MTYHAFNDAPVELRIGKDGFAHLSPYGDYPGEAVVEKPDGTLEKVLAIQRVDRQAVTDMVNEFHSWSGAARRFVRGRKLYVGHPDVPGMANSYPDPTPRGIFTALEARDDGLWGKLALTEEGERSIESGDYTSLSPYWWANDSGVEGGVHIFRPTVFRSAGLTNKPNLPVRSLQNEKPGDGKADLVSDQPAAQPKDNPMKEKLKAWLARQKVTVANDASEEILLAEIDKFNPAAIANELAETKTKLTEREAAIQSLTERATSAEASFSNERKATIARELDLAIADARIVPADRAAWEGKLSANFANELPALKALTKALKTETVTGDIGTRRAGISNAAESFSAAVRSVLSQKLEPTTSQAMARVVREHPDLHKAYLEAGAGPLGLS